MDAYKFAILIVGLALLGAAWVPHLVKRNPLTLPILWVALGALLYALPLPLPRANPMRYSAITQRLTEIAVLVALVGFGLRIGLFEHGQDLAASESGLFHGNLFGIRYEKIPRLAAANLRGDYRMSVK